MIIQNGFMLTPHNIGIADNARSYNSVHLYH